MLSMDGDTINDVHKPRFQSLFLWPIVLLVQDQALLKYRWSCYSPNATVEDLIDWILNHFIRRSSDPYRDLSRRLRKQEFYGRFSGSWLYFLPKRRKVKAVSLMRIKTNCVYKEAGEDCVPASRVIVFIGNSIYFFKVTWTSAWIFGGIKWIIVTDQLQGRNYIPRADLKVRCPV
jgi:hypothetical protein